MVVGCYGISKCAEINFEIRKMGEGDGFGSIRGDNEDNNPEEKFWGGLNKYTACRQKYILVILPEMKELIKLEGNY